MERFMRSRAVDPMTRYWHTIGSREKVMEGGLKKIRYTTLCKIASWTDPLLARRLPPGAKHCARCQKEERRCPNL